MRSSTAFLVGAVLALLFGAGFVLAPAMVLAVYALPGDAATVLMARFFGVALLQLGVSLWLLKETRDGATQRGLAIGGAIGAVFGIVVALMGTLTGTVNAMGWSVVAIYVLLLFGYFSVLRGPQPAMA